MNRLGAVLVLVALVSCHESPQASSSNEQAVLGGEIVARVGTEAISGSLVAQVAADQHIDAPESLRRLIDDAVSATGARARGLDRQRPATWLLTAARARWAADAILAEARRAGPPTEAEIEELTRAHWREVDRPPAVRVVHALAMRPKKPDEASLTRARALAGELHAAVLAANDTEEFLAKAKAVPHPPEQEVVVESLAAFAADGALLDAEGAMVEPFARAAHALKEPGQTSGIVETTFGWHVIRLVERLPALQMPLEARRAAFTEETFMWRARTTTEARLAALRASSSIEIAPSAESLMESMLRRGPTP